MSNVLTPEFRVSYPNVFKAKRNDLNGKDEYSIVALFAKTADLTELKKAIQKAITDKWGPDKAKWPQNLKSPLRDQADRVRVVEGKEVMPAGYEKGAFYLNLKSTQKPGVVDEKVQDIIDPSQFYGGCYARATIRAFAYDQKGNRGVSFGLGNIQKMRDGDPFGGRSLPQSDFAPIEGIETGNATATSANDLFS